MSLPPSAGSDPAPDFSNRFGVLEFLTWDHEWNSHHYDAIAKVEKALDLMQEAGVGWVRMDFFWADVELEAGRFDFSRLDPIVEAVTRRGLSILGLLHYNPAWRGGAWNQAPDPAAYEAYARQVVGHYKDKVFYWEIWNEPDHPTYWEPQDDLQTYSRLLARVAPTVRAANPQARVVMGGLSKDWPFHLRRIYEKAGAASFDVVNIHPFWDPRDPKAEIRLKGIYSAVRQVMREFGDESKPLWATEIGCPGVPTSLAMGTWWLGPSPSEPEQAAWVEKVFTYSLAPGMADKVFWAFFRDTKYHFRDGTDHLGLIRNDFSIKPAYATYRRMTLCLGRRPRGS